MWLITTVCLIIVTISLKFYVKLTCGTCICDTVMTNKVVIITGANTGIGFETAKDLAKRGAKIILACRDEVKGIQARDDIIQSTGNDNVIFKQLNLGSFTSVRTFAADILKTEQSIHVLINNAGTGILDNALTEDNLPIEAQVNHFAPFLLTVLLLPLLKSSAPSRIINLSSIMHLFGKIDPETFHKQSKNIFQRRRIYSNTKLANLLFTLKLSQLLKDTHVTVNAIHPGAVSTDIFRDKPSIMRYLIKLVWKTPYEGAQTSIHLAVAPELEKVTGKYFVDCREERPSKSAKDIQLADKLWKLSQVVTNVDTEKLI
ncbi:retinol dehydrogenase 12-like [Achroia grisella]|uniref:retinol dehydrogenase 12-like n=1 Tax=Achroia grisella TaxID=688607 RepID=UPI0027D3159B|nr:retinol dehydrogenase 12-like [Achroia grisella]